MFDARIGRSETAWKTPKLTVGDWAEVNIAQIIVGVWADVHIAQIRGEVSRKDGEQSRQCFDDTTLVDWLDERYQDTLRSVADEFPSDVDDGESLDFLLRLLRKSSSCS